MCERTQRPNQPLAAKTRKGPGGSRTHVSAPRQAVAGGGRVPRGGARRATPPGSTLTCRAFVSVDQHVARAPLPEVAGKGAVDVCVEGARSTCSRAAGPGRTLWARLRDTPVRVTSCYARHGPATRDLLCPARARSVSLQDSWLAAVPLVTARCQTHTVRSQPVRAGSGLAHRRAPSSGRLWPVHKRALHNHGSRPGRAQVQRGPRWPSEWRRRAPGGSGQARLLESTGRACASHTDIHRPGL